MPPSVTPVEALARRVRQFMARTYEMPLTTSPCSLRPVPRPWLGRDGMRIPRAADGRRIAWELQFLELLLEAYRLRPDQVTLVRVPTSQDKVEHANGVRSRQRYGLYRRMLAAGEPVPPIFVEQRAGRWFIWDGNHRTHAARDAGVTHLVGLARRKPVSR